VLGSIRFTRPLGLALAAEIAFPLGGTMTGKLRKEAAGERLVMGCAAGDDFTTHRAIADMREKCRLAKGIRRADQARQFVGTARSCDEQDWLRL
jgi:hypothetical protein